MSKDITEWVKSELYPRLFDSIDTVFPEHNFKSYPGGWRSKTYLSGSSHSDRADKTIVTKKAPGRILEQGDKNISLVDYVMERDKVDFIQAVKTLADKVNLQLPKGDFNQEDYQKQKDQANLLEECSSYFTYCLQTSTGAKEMREYLSSRGYSGEEVEVMELGYIPGQDKLKKYLLSKGYSQGLIDETVKLHPDIGSTHRLSIPYRSGGSLKGFVVRTIVKGAEPKYLVSTGLKRGDQFFNLKETKGDKHLIVVEGYLDTLISEAKGIDNIVGLGGAKFSREQVTHAVKKGAKSFTLCLDSSPPDRPEAGSLACGKRSGSAEGAAAALPVALPSAPPHTPRLRSGGKSNSLSSQSGPAPSADRPKRMLSPTVPPNKNSFCDRYTLPGIRSQ